MPQVLNEKIEKFEKFSNATETHNTNSTNSRKSCNIMDANESEKQKTQQDNTCSSSNSRSSSSRSSMNGATFKSKARQGHYNPSVRLLKIDKSTNGACGFHLTRSKWDPYPWVSAVDSETPAELSGLKAGDCVLEVNGEDILGLRITEIADLVKRTSDYVTLLLWSAGIDPNCDPQSLCCGPMPTNLRRLSVIVQNILSIIECPVCLDTISPPAMQCQNGHLLCLDCRIRAEKCPVCRDRYTPRRALIAEQIYTAITNAFNLCHSEDKLRLRIFGPNAQLPEPTVKMPEEKETKRKNRHTRARSAANSRATTPTLMPRNKFLAKLMGKSYSMDNIASSCNMPDDSNGLAAAATWKPKLGVMTTKELATTTMGSTSTPIATATTLQSAEANHLHETNKVRNHLTLGEATTNTTGVTPATTVIYKQHLSLSTNNLSQNDNRMGPTSNLATVEHYAIDLTGKLLSPMFLDELDSSVDDSVECFPVDKLNMTNSSSASTTSLSTTPVPAKTVSTSSTTSESSGIFSVSVNSIDSSHKNELLFYEDCLEKSTISAAAATKEADTLPSISLSVVLSTAELPVAVAPLSTTSIAALENTQSQTDNVPLESIDCIKNSFSLRKLNQEKYFRCPCNCEKIFNASSKLQRHVKVDHQIPILSFCASSTKLALPLQQPLDNAVVVLEIAVDDAVMKEATEKYEDANIDDETLENDDKRCIKECWIRLSASKENDLNGCHRYILLTGLLQGTANEGSDFMLQIEVNGSGHCKDEVRTAQKSDAIKNNKENAIIVGDVRKNDSAVVNGYATEVKLKQQHQWQQEPMTRSIHLNSVDAPTWNGGH